MGCVVLSFQLYSHEVGGALVSLNIVCNQINTSKKHVQYCCTIDRRKLLSEFACRRHSAAVFGDGSIN